MLVRGKYRVAAVIGVTIQKGIRVVKKSRQSLKKEECVKLKKRGSFLRKKEIK